MFSWASLQKLVEGRPKLGLTPEQLLMVLAADKHTREFSPDWYKLESAGNFTPLFVYCNMMHGGTRHDIIANLYKKYGSDGGSAAPYAFTKRKFAVWQKRDAEHPFPIALPSNAEELPQIIPGEIPYYEFTGMVKGRLYLIPSSVMKEIDKFKLRGVYFDRVEVPLLIPYNMQWRNRLGCRLTPEEVHPVTAWMYVGIRSYWDEQPMYTLRRCASRRPNIKTRKHLVYQVDPPKWRPDRPYYFFNPRGD